MSDLFGPLPIPLVDPASGEAAGDPLLTTLLSFFQDTLNSNASAAWSAVFTDDPASPVVKTTYAHDPEDTASVFNENALPALYLFRGDVKDPVWIAEDWQTQESALTLYWVMPVIAVREKRVLRLPIINGIARVLNEAVEFSTDTRRVPTGVLKLEIGAWKPYVLKLPMLDRNGQPRRYDALRLKVTVIEYLTFDADQYPPVDYLDLKVYEPDIATGLLMGDEYAGQHPFSTWTPGTAYALNDYVQPTTPGSIYYRCTTAGTSAVEPPDWPMGIGMTVLDGTAIWTAVASVP